MPRRRCNHLARTAHPISRRYGGFSLVELLVVMLLISLLLAILLPSLSRAMQQAAATICKHNLREVHQALEVYRLDNEGWIPIGENRGDLPVVSTSWFAKLYPHYLSDPQLLRCPSDLHPQYLSNYGQALGGSSYGLSDFIQSSPDGYLANLDRRQPRRALDTMLLADVGPDTVGGSVSDEPTRWASYRSTGRLPWDDSFEVGAGDSPPPWLTARHLGAINAVTIGGAVRQVPTRAMMGRTIESYYPADAAGDCPLCLDLQIPHYSFAHAQTFWWTGSVPER